MEKVKIASELELHKGLTIFSLILLSKIYLKWNNVSLWASKGICRITTICQQKLLLPIIMLTMKILRGGELNTKATIHNYS